MIFYTGTQFPAKYRGGIFFAQHGSWNRTVPIGARVMFASLKPDGTGDRAEVFAEGWLNGKVPMTASGGRGRAPRRLSHCLG